MTVVLMTIAVYYRTVVDYKRMCRSITILMRMRFVEKLTVVGYPWLVDDMAYVATTRIRYKRTAVGLHDGETVVIVTRILFCEIDVGFI